eukprot:g5989.t1
MIGRVLYRGFASKASIAKQNASIAIEALATQAEFCYGEGLTMLEHAEQAAEIARLEGENNSAILAALCHDVGNSPQARAQWVAAGNEEPELMISPADNSIGYRHHALIGGSFLESLGFSEEIANAARLHVSAKRALVGMDPEYMNELSQASIDTLAQQGGPLAGDDLKEFLATPGAETALRLRRYDDLGKVPGDVVPPLESYRDMIVEHLMENKNK